MNCINNRNEMNEQTIYKQKLDLQNLVSWHHIFGPGNNINVPGHLLLLRRHLERDVGTMGHFFGTWHLLNELDNGND